MASYVTNIAAAGATGVQLFFIASAFTLLHSWRSRSSEPAPRRSFLIRRYFRIAPLYILAVITYAILMPFYYKAAIPWTGVAVNALLLNGLVPAWNNNIVPGGWSIGTEVLVYAFLALASPWLIQARHARIAVAITVLITLGWYLLGMIYKKPDVDYGFRYWALPSQAMAFGVGFGLYTAWYEHKLTPVRGALVAGIGTGLILLAALTYNRHMTAYWWFLPGFVGLVWGFLHIDVTHPLLKALSSVGRASYAIYIGHFLILMVISRVSIRFHFPRTEWIFFLTYGVAVGLSYGFALLLGRMVERPGQEFGKGIVRSLQERSLRRRRAAESA